MRFLLEYEIDGFEPDIDVDLLLASDDYLTKTARRLGVIPINEFYCSFPAGEIDDAAEFIDTHNVDWRSWYDADEGLKTVKPLIKYLEENPEEPGVTPSLTETMKELEKALNEAKKRNLRWTIEID